SALVVGATSISLILLLSALALLHFHPAYLLRVELPFVGGRPLDPSILRLIFGVVLLAYFGHLSTGNCARDVLRRDPSAHSLIWGAAAAQATAIALYSVWVLSISGAITAEGLRGQSGTALAPLALVAGPGVHLVGSIFVVLAMGMGSIHYTLSLSNLVRERLPARARPVLVLARGLGPLTFAPRDERAAPIVGLAYLGRRGDAAGFRLQVQVRGDTRQLDADVTEHWDAGETITRLAGAGGGALHLALDVLDADEQQARVRLDSSIAPTYQGGWDALGLR